jgi:hypothetical protein
MCALPSVRQTSHKNRKRSSHSTIGLQSEGWAASHFSDNNHNRFKQKSAPFNKEEPTAFPQPIIDLWRLFIRWHASQYTECKCHHAWLIKMSVISFTSDMTTSIIMCWCSTFGMATKQIDRCSNFTVIGEMQSQWLWHGENMPTPQAKCSREL